MSLYQTQVDELKNINSESQKSQNSFLNVLNDIKTKSEDSQAT